MGVGESSWPVSADRIISGWLAQRILACNVVLAGGRLLMLALVETMAPPNALHNAAAGGCAVSLRAMLSCCPVIQRGTQLATGSSHVAGPGQLSSTLRKCVSSRACM